MYHKHHTKGIVIGSNVEGDDSRRVCIFTENFGLINARVQGARNVHSKLRTGSQDFCLGEFSLVHGRAGWKVVSTKSEINIFENLRYSPEKLKIAVNVLNLIKKLVEEEEVHTPIFFIISNFLNFLREAKEESVSLSECLVLLRILHSLGYMREDPDFAIPILSAEMQATDLELLAPRRLKMIELINESLKVTHLT